MQTELSIKVKLPDGVEISAPVDLSTASDAERLAFVKFNGGASLQSLTSDERSLLSKRKIYLRGEGVVAGFFCRWDWHPVVVD
jgi:hypothetical protein